MTVQSLPTIADTVQESFPFNVTKEILSGPNLVDENGHIIERKTDLYGLFRDDTHEQIADASKKAKYVPHTTDDVIALTEAAQQAFAGEEDCVLRCYFRKGHHVIIEPDAKHRVEIFGDKDAVFPRLKIDANYNGKAHTTTLGTFRDLCANLAMLKMVQGIHVKIGHRGNLRADMNRLIDDMSMFAQGWENLVDHIKDMESRELSFHDYVREIFPDPGDGAAQKEISIQRNILKAIGRRIELEALKTGRPNPGMYDMDPIRNPDYRNLKVTGWEAYNAIQGYIQHDVSRAKKFQAFDRMLKAASDTRVTNAEKAVFALTA